MLSVRYGRLPFYCSCDKILLSTGRKYFKQVSEKLEKMVNIIKKSPQEVAVLDYNKAA